MMSKFFFPLFLSILLVSCSGGGSSDTGESESDFVNSNNTSTVTTADGVVIRVSNGVPTIVKDPTGGAKITKSPDGGSIITTQGGSTVRISPDGSSITNESRN